MNPSTIRAAMPTAYVVVAVGSPLDPAGEQDVLALTEVVAASGVKAHVIVDPVTRYGITKQLIDDLGLGEVKS